MVTFDMGGCLELALWQASYSVDASRGHTSVLCQRTPEPLTCQPDLSHRTRGAMRNYTYLLGGKFCAEICFHCLAFITSLVEKPPIVLQGPSLILFCSIQQTYL